MSIEYISHNLEDTKKLGLELSKHLSKGDLILFYGGLGAGKTTLTKSIGEGLKIKDLIHSPTFTLVHEHLGDIKLNHIDLYRLESINEILNIGFEDYIYSDGITIVEWSENLEEFPVSGYIKIQVEVINDNERKFILSSDVESYNKMLKEVIDCIS